MLFAMFLGGMALFAIGDDLAVLRAVVRPHVEALVGLSVLVVSLVALIWARLWDGAAAAREALRRDLETIAHANPAHRAGVVGDRTDRAIAALVNDLADRIEAGERRSAEAVESARAELVEERNRLAALLEDLAEGVVVCNSAGEIVLFNEQARHAFAPCDPAEQASYVGLGRSVDGVVDRAQLERALQCLREAPTDRGFAELECSRDDGSLRARMTLVRDAVGEECGFVLSAQVPAALARSAQRSIATRRDGGVQASGRPRSAAPGRPEFYDFDLFRRRPAGELDRRPLAELAYTVFDTETTGLDPSAGDRVVSIGAVRIVNGRILGQETFDRLVDPRRPIPPQAERIHGIGDAMCAGCPDIATVLPQFHRFAAGTVLVGHNVAFDLRFFEMQADAAGVTFDHQPVLDTLLLAALLDPEEGADHSLDGLASRFGITVDGRHSALGDARATAQVFLRQIVLLARRGIADLGQAREASRRSLHARVDY